MRVLDDALADFEGQVQSAKSSVAEFEVFDNAQRVQVVIERKPVLAHGGVERLFSRVAERRMAEIVHQCERFHQIGVQSKLRGDGARDLRDLDGVRQAVAEVVGVAAGENLSLRFQAAKGAGMDDAIAVALKVIAVGMRRLGMAASAGFFYAHRIVGEHGESLACGFLLVECWSDSRHQHSTYCIPRNCCSTSAALGISSTVAETLRQRSRPSSSITKVVRMAISVSPLPCG